MVCPYPDHTEKTPSFFVNPDKGIAHCFGCGQGGTPLNFVMSYTGQSFPDSVREVASLFNIPIPSSEESKKTSNLFKAQEFSLEYFQNDLLGSGKVLDYLENRGFDKNLAKKYKLGYLDNSNKYLDALLSEGYSLDTLQGIGLINTKQSGSSNPFDYYSPFYDRVIFPIFDKWNRLIGFGGRTIDDEQNRAKYTNTKETKFFKKGRQLFGFNTAREHIRKNRKAYVTEGYFDVLSAHNAGLSSFVGPLGTSFTEDQALLVKSVADKIVFVLDPDKAGVNAALRAGKIAFGKGLSVSYKILPNDLDLDDFVRASDSPLDEFHELPEKDIIDFYLETNSELNNPSFINNPDNILSVVKSAADLIGYEKNYARKFVWLNKISESIENKTGKSVPSNIVEAEYYNSMHGVHRPGRDILSKSDSDLILSYVVNLMTVSQREAKSFVVDIPPELFSFDKKLFSFYRLVIDEYVNRNSERVNKPVEPNLFESPVPVIDNQESLFGNELQKNISDYLSSSLEQKFGERIHPYTIFNIFYESDKSTLPRVAGILKYRSNLVKRSNLINDLISAYNYKSDDAVKAITTRINRIGV